MLTTLLDLLGAALIVAFAVILWPPLGLAVAGVFCLTASWVATRTRRPGGDS